MIGLALFLVGVAASVIGSIVGLGGGFLIVPVLRIVLGASPAVAAGSSLVLVFANATGASLSNMRQRSINLRIGFIAGAGGIPGSITGALAVRHFASNLFDYVYAALLLVIAADVVRREILKPTSLMPVSRRPQPISDAYLVLGGFAVGFISSLLGIGGGIIVVPLLLLVSELPPQTIAATSSFVILLTSPVGVLAHALNADVLAPYAIPLAAGGIVGGQAGVRLSRRLSARNLIALLAATLVAAAVALVLRHLI